MAVLHTLQELLTNTVAYILMSFTPRVFMLSAILNLRSHFHMISFCNLNGGALAEVLEVNGFNPHQALSSHVGKVEMSLGSRLVSGVSMLYPIFKTFGIMQEY